MTIALMIMGVLICNQVAIVCYKVFSGVSDGKPKAAPAFMALWTCALGAVLVFVAMAAGGFAPSTTTLVIAVLGGLSFATAGVLLIRVMATGPFIWTVLTVNLSSFLPVLFSLAFLGETITLPQTGGVFLILSVLFVMNVGLKRDNRPFTTRWFVLAIVNMLANGAILITQKTQTHFTGGEETLEFLALMFLFTSLFSFAYYLFITRLKERNVTRAFLPPAFGLIAALGISNFLSMGLMARISAAVQFPVIVGVGMVLSAIISAVLYKEHIGWRLYVSAVLLTAGVILLGI